MSGLPTSIKLCQLNCENLFAFFAPSATVPSPLELTEAQWQSYASPAQENKPLAKLKALARTLLTIDADILMLNEIGGLESLETFNHYFLGNIYRPFLIEGNSERGIDVGYLVRRTLPYSFLLLSHRMRPIPLTRQEPMDLNPIPQFFSRDCLELKMFTEGSISPCLIFLLVHLKSKRDVDPLDPQGKMRRRAEAQALTEVYNELRRDWPSTPIVVGGDFNGVVFGNDAEDELRSIREATDLVDPFAQLQATETFTQIQFSRSLGCRPMRLDYLLASPHLENQISTSESGVQPLLNHEGEALPWPRSLEQRLAQPSDHFPVVLVLRKVDQLNIKDQHTVGRD